MAVRTVGLLILLCPPCFADGVALYDPRLCYILDAFLAGYGILITALYIKEKLCTSRTKTDKDNISDRNKQEETYTALKQRPEDEYKELPLKRERHKRKDEQVYQDLNLGTKDTYHTLKMQPLPPAQR